MTRGDLNSVTLLLNQADEHLRVAGNGDGDTPEESTQRRRTATAYGLLENAMETGLAGLRREIGQTRRGKKALRGYSNAVGKTNSRLLSG